MAAKAKTKKKAKKTDYVREDIGRTVGRVPLSVITTHTLVRLLLRADGLHEYPMLNGNRVKGLVDDLRETLKAYRDYLPRKKI